MPPRSPLRSSPESPLPSPLDSPLRSPQGVPRHRRRPAPHVARWRRALAEAAVAACAVGALGALGGLVALGGLPLPASASDPEARPAVREFNRLDPLLRRVVLTATSASSGAGQGLFEFPPTVPVVHDDLGVPRLPCWIHLDLPADAIPDQPPAGGLTLETVRRGIEACLDAPVAAGLRSAGPALLRGRFSLEEIARIEESPGVVRIEVARRARPMLDESREECGALTVQAPTGAPPYYHGFSGRYVVIGVIDTGADVTHEDFADAEGNTRIARAWDQTVATENPPGAFGYGREWNATEIDQGLCTMTDTQGHGTHVLGTAGGGGGATGGGQPAWQYVGIAPEAILVVVKTSFFTTDVLDAIDYVFALADAWGRRAVVNLSLGHQWGPHDGNESLESAVQSRCGPGRIVVAAAGNQQQDGIHAELTLPSGAGGNVTFTIPAYAPQAGALNDAVYLDGYEPDGAGTQITLTTPHGHVVGPVGPGGSTTVATADGAVTIDRSPHPGPSDNLFIEIIDQSAAAPPATGTWTLQVDNPAKEGPKTPITVDVWLPDYTIAGAPVFVSGRTDQKLVASPAGADSVIAVGAYITKRCWTSTNGSTYCYQGNPPIGSLASFSSRGPRRDGALKPDLCAPGMGIGAALSAQSSPGVAVTLADTRHVINQGTSMAAPHVAGVVALMLEARGALSVEQTLERLRSSARTDEHASGLPNAAWGFGKVDAIGATAGASPVLVLAPRLAWEEAGLALEWHVPDAFSRLRFAIYRGARYEEASLRGETGFGPAYRFIDADPAAEAEPVYWLQPLPAGDFRPHFGPFSPEDPKAGDSVSNAAFALGLPYPNPATQRLAWELFLPRPGRVFLRFVDLQGRVIEAIETDRLPAGRHPMIWELRDAHGQAPAAGFYWLHARWNGQERTQRALILPANAR